MPDTASSDRSAVETVFREIHGQVIATLVRVFGDIGIAEDAAQDAFVVATERWPRDGVPPNPAGWIVTTARRRAIDVLRRDSRGRELHHEAAMLTSQAGPADSWIDETGPVADDQLRLIFTCCHPALAIEHRVALTLRLLGGLSVGEIARSFLVSEAAMAKRLVRAKYKIAAARIPYRVPDEADLPQRLRGVLAVLYLIYNTGADDTERSELREEAVRLTRALLALMPDEPEVMGLLALMLLNDSRRRASRRGGTVVVLRDQDRSRWDRTLIAEGRALVEEAVHDPGSYVLQAAIQLVHCSAPAFGDTDWRQIVELYDRLLALHPSPVVALNRAIAVGEHDGPVAALAALAALEPRLDGYHLFHAARGAMLRALGRADEARAAYERAAELAPTEPDRMFLAHVLGELTD